MHPLSSSVSCLDDLSRTYRTVVFVDDSHSAMFCGHLRQLFSNHSYSAGGEGNSGDTEEKRKEYKSLCGRSHRCILDGCRLEKCIRFSLYYCFLSHLPSASFRD